MCIVLQYRHYNILFIYHHYDVLVSHTRVMEIMYAIIMAYNNNGIMRIMVKRYIILYTFLIRFAHKTCSSRDTQIELHPELINIKHSKLGSLCIILPAIYRDTLGETIHKIHPVKYSGVYKGAG